MNIKSLRIFISVMENGTLARASNLLHLSQPAASRLLRILEEEIGETLFLRQRKRLQPTVEAEIFLPEATRIVNSVDNISKLFEYSRRDTVPQLRLLCLPRIVKGLVIPALNLLDVEMPGIRYKIEVCPRREIQRRLLHGSYDIGVSSLPIPASYLETHYLATVQLHVMLSKNHPLATKPYLTTDDLKTQTYIALDQHTAVRRAVDQSLAHDNSDLTVTHEVSNSDVAFDLVKQGIGFAFVDPASISPIESKEVVLLRWSLHPEIEVAYFLPDAPQIHPARNLFVEYLKQVSEEKYEDHLRRDMKGCKEK